MPVTFLRRLVLVLMVTGACLYAGPLYAGPKVIQSPALPLSFEQNLGQVKDPNVKFVARGSGAILFFYPDHIAIRPTKSNPIELKLNSSSAKTSLIGSGVIAGEVNYFHGNNPLQWKSQIPSYSSITYRNLYAHVDMVIYGKNGQLESDFVVAPHGDLRNIRINAQNPLAIGSSGEVIIKMADGFFQLHRPIVYQLSNDRNRQIVNCRYRIRGHNEVSFAVEKYDHSKALIIDPILTYSSFLGGTDDEGIFGIGRDREGNLYIAGESSSVDFPNRNAEQTKLSGDYDCFVTKFDPTAHHLIYSTYLGGSQYDHCVGIGVNEEGSVFVAGVTMSADFPVRNAIQSSLNGQTNGFVAHLDHAGSGLVFSTYLGGSKSDFLNDIAIDRRSNVYVTGSTKSPDFPVSGTPFQKVCDQASLPGVCNGDAFVSKLNSNGTKLIYSTFLGGANYDSANGIAVDFEGSAYVTGLTSSKNFPLQEPLQATLAGFDNIYVSKISPDGSQLEYSTYIGGSVFDVGNAIAVDWLGNAYVTGTTNSPNFPTVNAMQSQQNGHQGDGFVLKLNSNGSRLDFSTYLGGSGFNIPFKIAVDLFGNASVVGFTSSTDFPLQNELQSTYSGGRTDAFVTSFTGNGASVYSTYLGGSGDDYGYAIYAAPFGGVWLGGSTSSTDFPLQHPFQASYAGGPFDAFLSKIVVDSCEDLDAKWRRLKADTEAEDQLARNDTKKADWLRRMTQDGAPQAGEDTCWSDR